MPLLEDDLLEMESRKGEEPCRKWWIGWWIPSPAEPVYSSSDTQNGPS